jgi:hypothetical protein
MSQQDILNFLRKNRNKYFTSREISEAINLRHTNAIVNLYKLRKTNFITFKLLDNNSKSVRYLYKYNLES